MSLSHLGLPSGLPPRFEAKAREPPELYLVIHKQTLVGEAPRERATSLCGLPSFRRIIARIRFLYPSSRVRARSARNFSTLSCAATESGFAIYPVYTGGD